VQIVAESDFISNKRGKRSFAMKKHRKIVAFSGDFSWPRGAKIFILLRGQ
jgi:hypothetical protein